MRSPAERMSTTQHSPIYKGCSPPEVVQGFHRIKIDIEKSSRSALYYSIQALFSQATLSKLPSIIDNTHPPA